MSKIRKILRILSSLLIVAPGRNLTTNAFSLTRASQTRNFSSTKLQASRKLFCETIASSAILFISSLPNERAWANDFVEGPPNEFIQELQARSDAKRDLYKKQSMDKLSPQQFKDQYKRPKFFGVRTSGGIRMFDEKDFQNLLKEDKILVDYERGTKRDGSEFIDRSKQFYVLVEEDVKGKVDIPTDIIVESEKEEDVKGKVDIPTDIIVESER